MPLPAAKVAETRLLRGISIPHHDRKSLPQTEPIKIWARIKISKACQMASPHQRGLSAVDASREGDEECLILIHPQQREGGVCVFRRALILWTAREPIGPEKRSKWDLSELPHWQG